MVTAFIGQPIDHDVPFAFMSRRRLVQRLTPKLESARSETFNLGVFVWNGFLYDELHKLYRLLRLRTQIAEENGGATFQESFLVGIKNTDVFVVYTLAGSRTKRGVVAVHRMGSTRFDNLKDAETFFFNQ